MSDSAAVTIAIIGAGQRGTAYARYAFEQPEKCKVVAVAEPRPKTREIMATAHNVKPELVFKSFDEFLAASEASISAGRRLVDAVVVAVHDQMHSSVVTALAKQGYPMLCEKPMATSPEECIEMADAVKRSGKVFGVGHVLRYSPYSQEVTKVIKSGALGEVVNIHHIEPIGYFHFTHSYVRGHWAEESKSSFSLLTKSCHDIDIICSYLAPSVPVRVSSFGSLHHFKKAKKPTAAGSATRCLDCNIKDSCAYSAKRIYLDPVSRGSVGWPAAVIVDGIPDIENIGDALKNGPYGQCVYESPNDVCDNQVVNLEFSGGETVSFTMVAFTEKICERETRIHFTKGELIGDMDSFTTLDFQGLKVLGHDERLANPPTDPKELHHPTFDKQSGHGGGDIGLIATFVEAVKLNRQDILGLTVDDILASHLTVFAAETSRREGRVVNVKEYENEVRNRMPTPPAPSNA